MAHYAYINENNEVVEVIVGKHESNFDWERHYGDLKGMLCKRTSRNTFCGIHYDEQTNEPSEDQSKALRKNFAGIGYTYDQNRDAFIPPKSYNSWVLNEQTCQWEAPVARPEEGYYDWDEAGQQWISINDGVKE